MNSNKNFNIYLTSKDGNKKLEKIKYNELLNKDSVTGTHIKADRNKIKQKLMGFGGALTESSASVFTKLNIEAREKIMDAYYSDAGNNYSMARTHINSCDFSLGNYSYCDVPGDKELKNFSIERDKEILIPFILDDKSGIELIGNKLTKIQSHNIFNRNGKINQINVFFNKETLFN